MIDIAPALAARTDKRFRRAHLKPSRRNVGWTSLRWRLGRWALALTAAGYAAHALTTAVVDARMLQVSRIVVHGNERLSNGEVLALLSGLRGQSILATDLDAWREHLLSSPWVEDASLRRVLPSTIHVVLAERMPLGIARFGSQLYLVDEQGSIVDEYGPHYAEFDLPIIDGLTTSSAKGDAPIDRARAALAVRVLAAIDKRNLAGRISQVDVTDARNAAVILDGDSALIRLGDRDFFEHLQSYLELAPALRERVPEIDYVDLRFDQRVYVRPATRANTRATIEGAAPIATVSKPRGR